MREMSVREFNQNVSQAIGYAERGEPTLITKNGKVVAKLIPQAENRLADPLRLAALEALKTGWAAKIDDGFRVGLITEDDLYDDPP